jgi:hypothetical protein
MIILFYPELTPRITHWQQRLEEMVLPHQLCPQPGLTLPYLENGADLLQGESSIERYLDELEHILKQWYACQCD